MRAALYARVSSEEQVEGYSIDAQRRAFRQFCETRQWVPSREYIEEGKSAHTDDLRKRPVFKQAINDAIAGQYDVLVVHKIDRFSRRLKVTLEYFEKLGKAGIGFVSIQNDIDYSTPTGKFMLVMQGGLAELYSDNLSEETKKGWHERRKQGLYCGTLPFGAMKGCHIVCCTGDPGGLAATGKIFKAHLVLDRICLSRSFSYVERLTKRRVINKRSFDSS
jgi:DNA invertase Pin-like site-specific DNA recombinase